MVRIGFLARLVVVALMACTLASIAEPPQKPKPTAGIGARVWNVISGRNRRERRRSGNGLARRLLGGC